jgi:uncharacterized phage-associated protein
MDEQFQFDREKFKELVHFIVDYAVRTHGSDALGQTKLHKTTYYADMLHFLDTGRPLTGADYQRQRFGPTARHLTWAVSELENEGRLSVSVINYYGYSKREYQSLETPNAERLDGANMALIMHVCDFVCAHTAAEISEFSHDDVWSSVPMGERIPYYAAYAMFPAQVTDADVKKAEQEAARIAPQIEAEKRARRIF